MREKDEERKDKMIKITRTKDKIKNLGKNMKHNQNESTKNQTKEQMDRTKNTKKTRITKTS